MKEKDLIEFEKRLKTAFGSKFLQLRWANKSDKGYLYLRGSEFNSIDLNNINQIGFSFHIGFLSVESSGQINKCIRVVLRSY